MNLGAGEERAVVIGRRVGCAEVPGLDGNCCIFGACGSELRRNLVAVQRFTSVRLRNAGEPVIAEPLGRGRDAGIIVYGSRRARRIGEGEKVLSFDWRARAHPVMCGLVTRELELFSRVEALLRA
jgi:hypothetical protein